MKQFLLAALLIAVPVAAFTGFEYLYSRATNGDQAATAGLGDLSSFTTIIADVQALAAKGDLAGAKTRIKDFEIAWDQAEAGLKPANPAQWTAIDEAADGAFTALRAPTPVQADVTAALTALQASLTNPPNPAP